MAKVDNKRSIYVYVHWQGLSYPLLMGILHSERLRGNEVFSFEYDGDWLESDFAYLLDPQLDFYHGPQFLSEGHQNFGMFLDSSPDRWGRLLMSRKEAAIARKENRPIQTLYETDYLLGVFDEHRMGALRFKEDRDGPFLNDNREMAAPPWTSIRELEQISLRLEEKDAVDNPEYYTWLKMLVDPGSSLGGARPKASVKDTDGNLWIAKFPSRSDSGDIGGWEMVTYEMALQAGINMAESRAQKFSSGNYTFLTKRFDRTTDGERLHFASAMTMLERQDMQDHTVGASYLEIVDFITSHGGRVAEDLEELWRRIVFSICVSNTDDHLRNHGFLLTEKGWLLSPAYDINPNESGTGLNLNISDDDNALDLELAMEVKDFFRLTEEKGQKIIEEVKKAVRSWRTLATRYGISRSEQEVKAIAFQCAES
ncbi:type II toxin-antitoxin system HipA family toxin [Bacteroidota bacterium]